MTITRLILLTVSVIAVLIVAIVEAGPGHCKTHKPHPTPKPPQCTVITPKPVMPLPEKFLHPNIAMVNRSELRTALEDAVNSIFTSQDQDVHRTIPEIIQYDGYTFESHEITTDDGYILTYYRIPNGINGSRSKNASSTSTRRRPVLIHHGLTTDSGNWIATARNDNLPYILADAGYDVWLANCRGTEASRGHKNKNIPQEVYWDFSFEEIGLHDLPAALNYILKTTRFKKLYYIGHSMGTSMVFSGCSLKPETCDKIHLFIALAPPAFMYRTTSAVRLVAPAELILQQAATDPSVKKLVTGPVLSDELLQIIQTGGLCNPTSAIICGSLVFLIEGYDYTQTNFTALPLWLGRATNYGSFKTLRHYGQNMLRDQFSRFDYGIEENCKRYKQTTPPHYNVGAIRTKTILVYGATDAFVAEEDVLELASKYNPKYVVVHKVPLPHFNHMDYMIAKNASQYIGEPILKYLKQHPMQD